MLNPEQIQSLCDASRPKLEAMVRDLGLTDLVELPGAANDMGEALSEGSVFVLSSRYEGFPLILLEAMSKGLACVGFDCPTGPSEIIEHHANGLLVPREDVEALARSIVELIEDGELRRRLGDAAATTALEYTMESIGPRWDRFFDELDRARKPPRERAMAMILV